MLQRTARRHVWFVCGVALLSVITWCPLLAANVPDLTDPIFDALVIGGSPAAAHQFPYMAALTRSGTFFCGATLYHPQYVVTAAHCFVNAQQTGLNTNPAGLVVSLNCIDRTACVAGGGVQVAVTAVMPHPLFNLQTNNYDICVLRLASNVTISPVLVINSSFASTQCACTNSIVMGFGYTTVGAVLPSNVLMTAVVPIISAAKCDAVMTNTITANMLCAGDIVLRKDTCNGDSGGPLLVQTPSGAVLVGITSWGEGACASAVRYGVYTRVAMFTTALQAVSTGGSWTSEPNNFTASSCAGVSDTCVSNTAAPLLTRVWCSNLLMFVLALLLVVL